jgi:serine/threonine-protein kinase/endoribonuclease IRE1
MLVSDFGLARRLEQDQSSFAPTANNLAGSLGWRAPECIRGQVRLNEVFDRASSCSSSSGSSSSLLDLTLEADEKDVVKGKGHARLTKAVDLFALGCLYFWVLTSGRHPFGEVYDRESNIVKGDIVNMSHLEILGSEQWEAKDLVGRLLSMDPTSR